MRAALVSERYDEKSANEKANIGTRHSDTYAIVWMRECMYEYVCCVNVSLRMCWSSASDIERYPSSEGKIEIKYGSLGIREMLRFRVCCTVYSVSSWFKKESTRKKNILHITFVSMNFIEIQVLKTNCG